MHTHAVCLGQEYISGIAPFAKRGSRGKADQFTGESGRAEKTLESSFPKPASEMVLIHSSSLTADDAAFARGIADEPRPVGVDGRKRAKVELSVRVAAPKR